MKRNFLKFDQRVLLGDYIRLNEQRLIDENMTFGDVANEVNNAHLLNGTVVTETNIRAIAKAFNSKWNGCQGKNPPEAVAKRLETMRKNRAARAKDQTPDDIQIVAGEILRLQIALGVEPSKDLERIAGC